MTPDFGSPAAWRWNRQSNLGIRRDRGLPAPRVVAETAKAPPVRPAQSLFKAMTQNCPKSITNRLCRLVKSSQGSKFDASPIKSGEKAMIDDTYYAPESNESSISSQSEQSQAGFFSEVLTDLKTGNAQMVRSQELDRISRTAGAGLQEMSLFDSEAVLVAEEGWSEAAEKALKNDLQTREDEQEALAPTAGAVERTGMVDARTIELLEDAEAKAAGNHGPAIKQDVTVDQTGSFESKSVTHQDGTVVITIPKAGNTTTMLPNGDGVTEVKDSQGNLIARHVFVDDEETGTSIQASEYPDGTVEVHSMDREGKVTKSKYDPQAEFTKTEYPSGDVEVKNDDGTGSYVKKNGERILYTKDGDWVKKDASGKEIDRGDFESLHLETPRN